MGDAFSEREKGFERKYVLEEEHLFKILARRDRLFGHWLASKMGLSPRETDAYVDAVVAANLERSGDAAMLVKVRRDLLAKQVTVSERELSETLSKCTTEAEQQLKETPPT